MKLETILALILTLLFMIAGMIIIYIVYENALYIEPQKMCRTESGHGRVPCP